MQPVRWDELQNFLAVARAGQIGRAADQLGVDATTVGRRLKRLQAHLGQTLFEQTRAGQTLTVHGDRLLRHVEAMQRSANRIVDSALEVRSLAGTLRISVAEGFGTWFIAEHLGSFVQRYPDLTVEIAANNGFLNPSHRETDVAIMLAPPTGGPVVSSRVTDYTLRMYASSSYLASRGTPNDVNALRSGHRLVGYVPELLYAPELDYLTELGAELTATVRSTSINAQMRMVKAGLGIGILPSFIGAAEPDIEWILPNLSFTRSFWIVTHRDTRTLERVKAFRSWLLDLVANTRSTLRPQL